MIKKFLAAAIFCGIFSSFIYCEATFNYGVLNVFTDLPEAFVVVDGLTAGKETVVKLPLEVGEHYVQVKLHDKLVYAEKVEIKANRSTTVTSEHFVDIITNTPSRGAIDREAERLRESRGNLALGYVIQTEPQPAASIKWWAFKNIGFQTLFLGAIPSTPYNGLLAGRIFLSPADKIFSQDVLTGYVFTGTGRYLTKSITNDLLSQSYYEFGINVEAKLGELATQLMGWKYQARPIVVSNDSDSSKNNGDEFLRDLIILGVLNLCYTSVEVTMIAKDQQPITTGFGVGFHVYF